MLRASPPLIWSFLYFFFLLTGYYVLRPVRDAMGAVGDLQWLFTATFVTMVVLQPFYGAIVARFPRRVFLPIVYLFFIACLLGFHGLFGREVPWVGDVFFVWLTVFNLFAVSVFWSFMADVFSDAEARRLYGYIAVGGTVGGFLGPWLTRHLVLDIGIANLMLVSAAMLAMCLLCIMRLRRWVSRGDSRQAAVDDEAIGGSILAGLALIWRQPLLRALALLLFTGLGGATLVYNEQAAITRVLFPDSAARTSFYSSIDLAVNTTTLIVQLLLTRALLTRFRLATVLLIPPCIALIGFSILLASPLPLMVAAVQVSLRAGEFSLMKPARETIYTRVEREWRYKAKAAIDTVVYRGADLIYAWLHKVLALGGSSVVFGGGVVLSLAFIAGAWWAGRAQARFPDPASRGAAPATPAAVG